ncbi:MAG: EamA family transporter, partial [Bacteroidota bacterium]
GVAFFWGTTFLAIKIGVKTMPPFLMAGSRHFIGGVLICSFFLIKGHKLPDWSQFKVFIINGFLLLVLGNGLVTWAEIYISSGLAALICALTPLSIITMNMLFGAHKEKLKAKAIAGIVVCLAAQVIIFRDNLKELADPNYLTGVLFIVIAIIGWGLGSIYSKNKQTGIAPLYTAGLQMISAGTILLIFGSLIGEWPMFKPDAEGIYSLAYLIVFGSLIAFGSYMYVLKQLPATIVSTYAYINTIVAVILGWLWLDEKLNAAVIIAVILTIGGVWLVNSSFSKKEKV